MDQVKGRKKIFDEFSQYNNTELHSLKNVSLHIKSAAIISDFKNKQTKAVLSDTDDLIERWTVNVLNMWVLCSQETSRIHQYQGEHNIFKIVYGNCVNWSLIVSTIAFITVYYTNIFKTKLVSYQSENVF